MEEDAGVVNSCEPWCGSGIELGTSTRTSALVLEATTQPSFWIVLTASLWSQASLERGLLLPHHAQLVSGTTQKHFFKNFIDFHS